MQKPTSQGRIALAIEHPLLQQGGIEVLIQYLIPQLARTYEVVLVSRDANREALGDFSQHLAAHHPWLAPGDAGAARKLAGDLTADGVSLVHFHGAEYEWECGKAWRSPIRYASKAGMACVMTTHLIHSLLEGYAHEDRPAWQKALLLPKAWLSKASVIRGLKAEILVSKRDEAQLRRYFPQHARKIRQIYHSRLLKDDADTAIAERRKVILCLGAICERKNQVGLMRAFARVAGKHPEWSLQLAGRCETQACLDEIRSIAANAGIAGRLELTPPQKDPSRILAEASVFALPSFREGLPLSVQEALYAECACVASRLGGMGELIDDGKNGLLVDPGDEAALAGALDRLMSDAPLRARLGKAGRQWVLDKGMFAEAMLSRHLRLYETILAGGEASEVLD